MNNIYVLDACALIALFNDEPGADDVERILREAFNGTAEIYMTKINIYEIYYGIYKSSGKENAEQTHNLIKKLPIIITEHFSDDIFYEAARLKSLYKISVADSIALGEAIVRNAQLLTADHHEFDVVEQHEKVKIHWIR